MCEPAGNHRSAAALPLQRNSARRFSATVTSMPPTDSCNAAISCTRSPLHLSCSYRVGQISLLGRGYLPTAVCAAPSHASLIGPLVMSQAGQFAFSSERVLLLPLFHVPLQGFYRLTIARTRSI